MVFIHAAYPFIHRKRSRVHSLLGTFPVVVSGTEAIIALGKSSLW